MRALIAISVVALAFFAACGSGDPPGSTPTSAPATSPTATPTPATGTKTATPPPVFTTPPPAVSATPCSIDARCGVTPEPTMVCDPAACASPTAVPDAGNGWIEGTVLVGPTCPVERPDSPCPDRPLETDITILDAGGAVVARLRSDSDGRFRLALPPGNYVVRGESGQSGLPSPGEPQPVTVRPGVTATVDLSYDSGIR